MPLIRLTLLIALAASSPAYADDFCVHNDNEFKAALIQATFAPAPNRIQLVANWTYHLDGTLLDNGENPRYTARSLTIEGGYNGLCSAIVDRNAASTLLDGTGTHGIWIDVRGQFTLANLSVRDLGGRLRIQSSHEDDARIRLLHTRFLGGAGVVLRQYDGDGGLIRVENSLFTRMIGTDLTEEAALRIIVDNPSDGADVVLVNNTIAGNRRHGLVLGGTGLASLYNNILWGNATEGGGHRDLRVDSGSAAPFAAYNIIGQSNATPRPGSTGNLAADPRFVSATDHNLATGSPARDSGTSAVPYGLALRDVEGGDRVVGNLVDRGAFEADSSGATVLMVTNANDSGPGSLRAAILEANANPAPNLIGFNIPGSCPRTISVASELPPITDSVSIRGYTQPGAATNTGLIGHGATICVELIAGSSGIANGLRFAPSSQPRDLSVSGLAIGGFGTGIHIDGALSGEGSTFQVWGNFLGVAADGATGRANVFGIAVREQASGTIGGEDAAQRNLIARNSVGVRLAAPLPTLVVNNYIGTARSGNASNPNVFGVAIYSPLQKVIDNLISGNDGDGIHIENAAFWTTLRGNRIGVKALALCVPQPCAPDSALGNGNHGVSLSAGSAYNLIAENEIAWNTGAGVRVTGTGSIGNRISRNRLYDNGGLGIDLGALGVDPPDNDAMAAPDSPNRGLNHPMLGLASGGETSGRVRGFLRSIDGVYTIEVYVNPALDPSGYGEGRIFLGEQEVTITGAPAGLDGQADFDIPVSYPAGFAGRHISAIAIDGSGNTSEFSRGRTWQLDDRIFADTFEELLR